MKDAFNEGLPYITQFIALHLFLKGPQILLTFIRHLALIQSNLIKQNKISLLFRIKFKQFHTFSAYKWSVVYFFLYSVLMLYV